MFCSLAFFADIGNKMFFKVQFDRFFNNLTDDSMVN